MRRRDPALPEHISAFLHEVRYVDVGMIASSLMSVIGARLVCRVSWFYQVSHSAYLTALARKHSLPKPMSRTFVRAVITTDCLIWELESLLDCAG